MPITTEELLAHPCKKCGAVIGQPCTKSEDYAHRSHADRFRRAVRVHVRKLKRLERQDW
jgi:hypothetical protein